MAKEFYVPVCPKCKSPDIRRDQTNKLSGVMGLPSFYICNKCGQSGYSFPEVSSERLKEFEKEAKPTKKVSKEIPKVDISYGKFQVKIMWKVSGVLSVFLGLFIIFNSINYSNILTGAFGAIFVLAGLFLLYLSFKSTK